jgi:predicted alpha/beta-fold hydrolase
LTRLSTMCSSFEFEDAVSELLLQEINANRTNGKMYFMGWSLGGNKLRNPLRFR